MHSDGTSSSLFRDKSEIKENININLSKIFSKFYQLQFVVLLANCLVVDISDISVSDTSFIGSKIQSTKKILVVKRLSLLWWMRDEGKNILEPSHFLC